MKKFYSTILCMAAILTAGSSMAAVTDTGKMLAERPRFMPAKYTTGDKTQFVTVDYDDDATKFTILDSSFGKIKDITTPVYPEVSATRTERQNIYGPINITVSYTYDNEMYGLSEEEFKDMATEYGYTVVEQHDTETWYLSPDEWAYYYYDIYKTKYPTRVLVWKNGAGYERYLDYNADDWGYTGIYGEAYTSTDTERPYVTELVQKSDSSADMDELFLTQTLFNSDDQYEWIIPVWEAVDCSYQTTYYIVEGSELRIKSFKVMSENGSTVTTFDLPTGYYCNRNEAYLYEVGDENYIILDCTSEQTFDRYYAIYSVSATTGRVEIVGEPMKVRVSPTAPRRGTPVTVTLGQASASSTVSVISTDGRTVMSRKVQPGVTSMEIPTDNLRSGMYIVNVTDGKTTRQATKIIVR